MSFDVGCVMAVLSGVISGFAIAAAYNIGYVHGYKLGKRDGYMFPDDKGIVTKGEGKL